MPREEVWKSGSGSTLSVTSYAMSVKRKQTEASRRLFQPLLPCTVALLLLVSCGKKSTEIPSNINRAESAVQDSSQIEVEVLKPEYASNKEAPPLNTDEGVPNENDSSGLPESTDEALGSSDDTSSGNGADDVDADPPVMIIGAYLVACIETETMTRCIAILEEGMTMESIQVVNSFGDPISESKLAISLMDAETGKIMIEIAKEDMTYTVSEENLAPNFAGNNLTINDANGIKLAFDSLEAAKAACEQNTLCERVWQVNGNYSANNQDYLAGMYYLFEYGVVPTNVTPVIAGVFHTLTRP